MLATGAPRSAALQKFLIDEFAYRLDADGQGCEICGASGAHVRECALPMRELFTQGLHPRGDARFRRAAFFAAEYSLREFSMNSQCVVAQPCACDGLPRSID